MKQSGQRSGPQRDQVKVPEKTCTWSAKMGKSAGSNTVIRMINKWSAQRSAQWSSRYLRLSRRRSVVVQNTTETWVGTSFALYMVCASFGSVVRANMVTPARVPTKSTPHSASMELAANAVMLAGTNILFNRLFSRLFSRLISVGCTSNWHTRPQLKVTICSSSFRLRNQLRRYLATVGNAKTCSKLIQVVVIIGAVMTVELNTRITDSKNENF
jgi:hypothetical protein